MQYQFLMTQSFLVFYSENVWSKDHSRKTQKTLHWILQAIGSTAVIAGIIIEIINRCQTKKLHFTTEHSIIGLIAGILTSIGILNGISALWSIELRKYARPVYLKLAHNFTGILAFVLGEFQSISTCFWKEHIVIGIFWIRYGFALVRLWQKIHGSEFTPRYSHVVASFGHHNNSALIDWRFTG